MSLQTDRFFFLALTRSDVVRSMVGKRVFNPSEPCPDTEILQQPIPYACITLESVVNHNDNKDEGSPEGESDTATVAIVLVAANRDRLATLAEAVRTACLDLYNDESGEPIETQWGFEIEDWQFSAGPVMYDPMKPCVYQTLRYACETTKRETNND